MQSFKTCGTPQRALRTLGPIIAVLFILLLTNRAFAAPASVGPTIDFDMMANGDTIHGNSADLMASIGGADVMAVTSGIVLDGTSIGRPAVPGHGFWEALIDGKSAGISIGDTLSIPNDILPQIASGPHTVQLVLLSNDWQQLAATSVITLNFANTMSFAPAAGPPGIAITKITAPSSIGRFEVRVQVSGFKLSAADVGKAPVAGEGHWNVYVDGKYAGMSVTQMVTIPNDALGAQKLPVGQHTLKAQLVNNDDSPVVGAVVSNASITLGPPAASPAVGSPATVMPTLPKPGEPIGASDLWWVTLAAGIFVAAGLFLRRRQTNR